jgi:hypothetical protein
MPDRQGELAKLKIIAYSDQRFEKPVEGGEFTAQINPEKVAFKYQIELEDQQAQGTSAAQPRFGNTKPEELTFEFLFDATGAIPLPNGESAVATDGITQRLTDFKAVVLDFNGQEHKPNNLKLIWGKLLFKCVLAELNLDYTLFRSDGTPLRAKAGAKFVGYVEGYLEVARANRLTNFRNLTVGQFLRFPPIDPRSDANL